MVAALGGNALLKRGEPLEAEVQRRNVQHAVDALAPIALQHELAITHGNGPQVGLLALESYAYREVGEYPLDVLGAESEGMIGYMIEQELAGVLPGREVAVLLTQVAVDPDDPAFRNPTKPIGPWYDEADAERLQRERGWSFVATGGQHRRVVPSPLPQRILEIRTIRLLIDAGVVVISVGGGGIPVIVSDDGLIRGVEGVIDKDRAAALLAREIGADALLLLTDVDGVYAGWGTDDQRLLGESTPDELAALDLEAGSMGPKVEAACGFARDTGGLAGIGALGDAAAILAGEAGTRIRRRDQTDITNS
ncbi:MAG TPA: carbamate kinase [Arenicellales bacterium]|nr:carbamate kinase [Arenicellales bacterium]